MPTLVLTVVAVRAQERPEDVPTGELPRSMQLVVDRAMVGTIAPGTRVTAVGIYSTVQVRLLPAACPALTASAAGSIRGPPACAVVVLTQT